MERQRNIFKNIRKYAFTYTFKLSYRKKKEFRNKIS